MNLTMNSFDSCLLQAVLFVANATPSSLDEFGRNPLHYCCQMPSPYAVDTLLSLGDFHINQMDCIGQTPLIGAIQASYSTVIRNFTHPIVRMLLEHGADPNLHGSMSLSPLLIAVLQKDLYLVEILLQFGANVNVRTDSEDTLLPGRSSALSLALRGELTEVDLQIIWQILARSSPSTIFHAIQKVPRHVKSMVMEMIQMLQSKPIHIHLI